MTNKLQTQDFYCSAYLMTSGIQLLEATQAAGRTVFEFPDTDRSREFITKYYSSTALIDPAAYSNAIRNLKSVIHSNLTKPNQQYVKQYRQDNMLIGQR